MIAFFDSGFGGLSIFREVEKLLPEYDYIYLGDQLRTPYGGRSNEAITDFTFEAIEYLRNEGVTLIIIACHTASSIALRTLQQEYADDIQNNCWNILGVTIPLAEEAADVSKNKNIGVVGTRATIASRVFETEIQKIDSNLKVAEKACPLLVPLVEEGWLNKPETRRIVKHYLDPLKTHNIDTLVLGCTHYPLLLPVFKQKAGKRIKVLNSGEIVARKLKKYLSEHTNIEAKCSKNNQRRFLTTDCPERFEEIGKLFLGRKLPKIEKVSIVKN